MKQLTLFDEEELTGIEDDAPDIVREAWKKAKKDMKNNFTRLQQLSYKEKIERQTYIAKEFYEEMQKRNCGAHVSVGGLDSITLFIWLKSIGINVPAISVSGVEDKSIQKVHKALGIEIVKSYKTKVQVLNEVGFPVISKRIAGKIDLLQNPTEDNKTVFVTVNGWRNRAAEVASIQKMDSVLVIGVLKKREYNGNFYYDMDADFVATSGSRIGHSSTAQSYSSPALPEQEFAELDDDDGELPF